MVCRKSWIHPLKVEVMRTKILELIDSLKDSKSPVLDGVYTRGFIGVKYEIADLLTKIRHFAKFSFHNGGLESNKYDAN